MDDEVAIENIVGNWERVCLENDALGFQFLTVTSLETERCKLMSGTILR